MTTVALVAVFIGLGIMISGIDKIEQERMSRDTSKEVSRASLVFRGTRH